MTGKPYADITDQELLERFYHEHDNQWLGVIFQRYTLLLLGVCMKYLRNEEEARDAVQQVYLKAMTELHKYKVTYFKSWIYMIAKNHCLMQLRNRGSRITTEVTENLMTEDEQQYSWQKIEQDRQLELMETSLEELNPEQKRCVMLFYLEKKSYQQITAETGYTMMQVKSHIQNGKRNLRIIMERKMNSST